MICSQHPVVVMTPHHRPHWTVVCLQSNIGLSFTASELFPCERYDESVPPTPNISETGWKPRVDFVPFVFCQCRASGPSNNKPNEFPSCLSSSTTKGRTLSLVAKTSDTFWVGSDFFFLNCLSTPNDREGTQWWPTDANTCKIVSKLNVSPFHKVNSPLEAPVMSLRPSGVHYKMYTSFLNWTAWLPTPSGNHHEELVACRVHHPQLLTMNPALSQHRSGNVAGVLTQTQNIGHFILLVDVLMNLVVTQLTGVSGILCGGMAWKENRQRKSKKAKKTTRSVLFFLVFSTQLNQQ